MSGRRDGGSSSPGRRVAVRTFQLGLLALAGLSSAGAGDVVESVRTFLSQPASERGEIAAADFADDPLTAEEATAVIGLLREKRVAKMRADRAAEHEARAITVGPHTLQYLTRSFGEPAGEDEANAGRPLLISMHGGGNTLTGINDRQWRNQIRLYELEKGIVVAPRAPTDTWNLWHEAHIDPLLDRLIENMILFEGVDPNRVYLTGYSAGGDGTYQLAPRMSDRFAGAAMMAGHPNETVADGLRNVPFALHMGGEDAAYRRNAIARDWQTRLAKLRQADPGGYEHEVVIREGLGHWMNGLDREGITWIMQFERNRRPDRVVWVQDDVTHRRLYWLAIQPADVKAGDQLIVRREGNRFSVERADVRQFKLLLDDSMIDFDRPVIVTFGGQTVLMAQVKRTVAAIANSLRSRPDPSVCATARLSVRLPEAK